MIDLEMMQQRLKECGFEAALPAAADLVKYLEMLKDWNTRMDLTAVLKDAEMVDRHFMDSLAILHHPELLPDGVKMIDVGTGAGFPGMVIAIARRDVQVTLLDSLQKRLTFLQAVKDALVLDNVTIVHARAEDGAHDQKHREAYDIAVARAVAPSNVLMEYLLPYVKTGGRVVLWKGPSFAEEKDAARKAAFLLGGKQGSEIPYAIPGRDWAHLLSVTDKTGKTPAKYPRKAGTPSKSPLGV